MAVVLIAVLVATLAPRIRLGPLVPTRPCLSGSNYEARSSLRGRHCAHAELRNS
jgi:hypothetical protein